MKVAPSVRGNIIANFAGRAYASVLSLAFIPLYIKLMGVEVYGLLGIFISLSALLSLLDMGLSSTLSRELSRLSATEGSEQETHNLVRTFEAVYWVIGILIGISVVSVAPIIAKYWINAGSVSVDIVQQALIIMGVLVAFQWPSSIYSGGLMGLQRQVVLNVIRSVAVTLQHGGAVLALLLVSPSILTFFFWQAIVGLLTSVALAVWLWKSLPKTNQKAKFDKGLLIKNWRFAAGMTGISLVTIWLTQLDKIILSKMLTLEIFGYYMLAFNVANALNNIVSPISSALFPKFTQLSTAGEENKLAMLYHKGCQLLSVLVLPVAITIAFFAKDILALWLSNPIVVENTHQILTLLIIGTALNAVMTTPFMLQLAHGWTQLAFYKNIIAVTLLVPLMIWMVEMYQGIGAAWVWIILNLGYLIFEVPIMHRRLLKEEMGNWYRQDIIKPIIIVSIIGGIARVIVPADPSKVVTLLAVLSTLAFSLIGAAWAEGYLNTRVLKTKFFKFH